MITVKVETKQGFQEDLHFLNEAAYNNFMMTLKSNPNSNYLVHGWERSIRLKGITRVISIEEEN